MSSKKMGNRGTLMAFSGIKPPRETTPVQPQEELTPSVTAIDSNETPKLVAVNIKITKTQKDWLTNTAAQVRDNNTEAVPPSERVYPQHLIGIAIDLLQAADVDWQNVRNIKDLQELLNL